VVLDNPRAIDTSDLIPLGLAIVLGGAIGLERERRGRAAGLRTMIMVCLGSTLVMLVSERLGVEYAGLAADRAARIDPTRIAAGIVTGIGFLGAGVVIKLEDMTRGVTTAATIWFVAALGIAIGDHHYTLAILATLLGVGVLTLLKAPERWVGSHVYRLVKVTSKSAQTDRVLESVRTELEAQGARLMDLRAQEDLVQATCELSFYVRLRQGLQGYDVLKHIRDVDGILEIEWK
jgi:putative Mg2+ transporter-C (MgtC) family protein